MLLKEIFEDFNLKYSNNPIEFEDKLSSDGIRNSYELSYSPLSDYDPYRPMVFKTDGEIETELLEGSDYLINHEAGTIQFMNIPESGTENISVRAFYQKCNLAQFIGHYNASIRLLQMTFPIERVFKITGPEDDYISSFRKTDDKFKNIETVKEIYQNEDDKNFVPFSERGFLVMINPSASMGVDVRSPGDYGGFTRNIRPGIKYPFYILGHLRYEELPIRRDALQLPVEFERNARGQIVLLIGRYMYESWVHKSWSLTSTVLNINEIVQLSKMIMSIDMQLYGDLRSNFTPTVLPNTRKENYSTKKYE